MVLEQCNISSSLFHSTIEPKTQALTSIAMDESIANEQNLQCATASSSQPP